MPRRKPAVLANERLRIIIRASTMIIRLLHFLSLLVIPVAASATITNRPNILWIVVDDMSANFSCYGETTIRTPHVDRLAAEGVRFTRAYATAPVCSALGWPFW